MSPEQMQLAINATLIHAIELRAAGMDDASQAAQFHLVTLYKLQATMAGIISSSPPESKV
jgi:hypothetical protein